MEEQKKNNVEITLEEEANRYMIKCMNFTMVGIIVCWILDFLGVFIVDLKLMSMGLLGIIGILIPVVICRFIDVGKPWVKYMLMFGLVIAITVQGISLTYHTVIMTILPLFLSIQYSKRNMIYYTYFLSVISIAAIVFGGYFFGLCDANMIVETSGPTREYFDAVKGIEYFAVSQTSPWIRLPLYFILPRCLLLLLFLPLLRKIPQSISKTAVRLSEVQKEAEEDVMTGVYNKNKYLSMVRDVYPSIQEVGVIFWDINNLKETNDIQGHHKGDYLITCTAYLLKELLESNRKVYRIGGDEFVMIVENPKQGEMEQIIDCFKESVHQKEESGIISLYVATGYAAGAGKKIVNVINAADQAMYENKKRMKEEKQNQRV